MKREAVIFPAAWKAGEGQVPRSVPGGRQLRVVPLALSAAGWFSCAISGTHCRSGKISCGSWRKTVWAGHPRRRETPVWFTGCFQAPGWRASWKTPSGGTVERRWGYPVPVSWRTIALMGKCKCGAVPSFTGVWHKVLNSMGARKFIKILLIILEICAIFHVQIFFCALVHFVERARNGRREGAQTLYTSRTGVVEINVRVERHPGGPDSMGANHERDRKHRRTFAGIRRKVLGFRSSPRRGKPFTFGVEFE